MARSSKKGPYIDQNLIKKLAKNKGGEVIKTYARGSQISPDFIGHRFAVHNGRRFIEIYVTEDMVGHRFGEFALTRTFKGHGRVVKRVIEKT